MRFGARAVSPEMLDTGKLKYFEVYKDFNSEPDSSWNTFQGLLPPSNLQRPYHYDWHRSKNPRNWHALCSTVTNFVEAQPARPLPRRVSSPVIHFYFYTSYTLSIQELHHVKTCMCTVACCLDQEEGRTALSLALMEQREDIADLIISLDDTDINAPDSIVSTATAPPNLYIYSPVQNCRFSHLSPSAPRCSHADKVPHRDAYMPC